MKSESTGPQFVDGDAYSEEHPEAAEAVQKQLAKQKQQEITQAVNVLLDNGATLAQLKQLFPPMGKLHDDEELVYSIREQAHRLRRSDVPDDIINRTVRKMFGRHQHGSVISGRMDEAKGTQWLVPNWIPRGLLGLFSGSGGFGKSRWSLQLAYALATGQGWHLLGLPHNGRKYRVMVAGYEDGRDEQLWRLWSIAKECNAAPSPEIPDDLFILDRRDMSHSGEIWGQSLNLQSIGQKMPGWNSILGHAAEKEVDLLIIDPLSSAFQANENDRSAVSKFTSALNDFTEEHDMTIILISHPPKSGDFDYSGSTAWLGGIRFGFTMSDPPPPDVNRQTKEGKEIYKAWKDGLTPFRKDLIMFKSNRGLPQDPIEYINRDGVWHIHHEPA